MKFTTIFTVVAAATVSTAVGVVAVPETNGARLARGLPPLRPSSLGTRVNGPYIQIFNWSYHLICAH
jgi:hypothetical protein